MSGVAKHVTVNDEPEIFNIRPDTLEVERQEKPRPLHVTLTTSTEEMSPEELADLIQETESIIQICEEKIMNQKLTSVKLGFMLIRIAESMEEYEVYTNHLNRFLVSGSNVTANYFIDVCKRLPPYGDFLRALGSVEDSSVAVGGVEGPLEKKKLQLFVKNVQTATYSGGMSLATLKSVIKGVNKYMQERRRVTERFRRQIGSWLALKNAVNEHLDDLRDRVYKLSAFLDFVKSGEKRIKPAPDGSSLEASGLSPVTSSNPVSKLNSGIVPSGK